jgi:hypothetical protein
MWFFFSECAIVDRLDLRYAKEIKARGVPENEWQNKKRIRLCLQWAYIER